MEIDDITRFNIEKKRINSTEKGKRTERALCKMLISVLGSDFSRTIGSGNRWSQATLPKYARDVFTGDLVCPENFKFTIEIKGGYEKITIHSIISGSNSLDKFLKQVNEDSKRCGKKPLLVWKQDNRQWLCFVKQEDMPTNWKQQTIINYREWQLVKLVHLLELDKSFWFNM